MSSMNKIFILLLIISSFLNAQTYSEKDVEVCKSKFQLAVDKNLSEKRIGDVIAAIGKSFIGTEYVAHTLEKGDSENLVIDLTGLDCTTFLENDLVFARCIKKQKTSFKDYQNELEFVRYRDGKIDQYLSRLHYFSDWIFNNEHKNVVKNISKEIGGVPIKFDVSFMSQHPDAYVQLKNDPAFIPVIKNQEEKINSRKYFYIPKEKIASVEDKIDNGDLIAITTSKAGLDIGHVGIAVREKDGRIHFMHAPDVGYKVQITDEPLSDYLFRFKHDTGIMVLQPFEP
jgi:N-acetylmuramoyl-L-alanine amidase-like